MQPQAQVSMGAAAQQQEVTGSVPAQEEPQKKQGFFSKLASSFSFGGKGGGGANKQASQPMRMMDMDRNLSCEEMDSDDLGGDLNLSD